MLGSICAGYRRRSVSGRSALDLPDPHTGEFHRHASEGWDVAELAALDHLSLSALEPLLDPAFEIDGCYLLEHGAGVRTAPGGHHSYRSASKTASARGLGRALAGGAVVETEGELSGVIWADEPADRLLPEPAAAPDPAGVRKPGNGRTELRRATSRRCASWPSTTR